MAECTAVRYKMIRMTLSIPRWSQFLTFKGFYQTIVAVWGPYAVQKCADLGGWLAQIAAVPGAWQGPHGRGPTQMYSSRAPKNGPAFTNWYTTRLKIDVETHTEASKVSVWIKVHIHPIPFSWPAVYHIYSYEITWPARVPPKPNSISVNALEAMVLCCNLLVFFQWRDTPSFTECLCVAHCPELQPRGTRPLQLWF